MNLLQTIRTIEEVAKGIPNVHAVVSAFEDLNREDTVYSAVIIQQQSHTHNDDWMQYNFYIGYADRLVEDGSNELSVQSTAMNTIHSIVRALRNILPSAEISYSNTNVFTQRFTALCAGAYETVSIILPISECDDSNEGIPGLDALSTTITENGDYNFVPDGLGFDSVHVVVDVQPEVSLEDKSISINENGQVIVTTTPGFTGMSRVNINVDVPQAGYKEGYDEGYSKGHQEGVNEGYADGVAMQKSKLQDITITNNGTYDREDGYKHIVVDVPASASAEGYTININENGTFTYTPQEGVVWNSVTVITNIPTEDRYQEGYNAGYAAGREAGYTEGYTAGREAGKAEGIAEQKAKLGSIEITANGTYEKEDGYNRVVVNVESHNVNLQEKTTNPATTAVEVTPDLGFDGLSKVTVNPVDSNIDPNIVPENIKTGVTVLGVEGTFKGEKPEERFNVQPSTIEQTITPTTGKVFSGGTVKAVTSTIDSNIQPENIKTGVTILGVEGTLKVEKPEERFNIQPTTSDQTITPTEGSVFSGGTVHAVTSNIDPNIVPENIKTGVTILGVEGTVATPTGTIQITENGEIDVTPYATAVVNVTTPATSYKVPEGLKFSHTTLSELPADLDFSDVRNLDYMFSNSSIVKLPNTIDWKNITSLSSTFEYSSIKELPKDFVVDNCSNIYAPFSGTNIKNLPTLAPKVPNNLQNMLFNSNIESIDSMDLSYTTYYEAIQSGDLSPLKSCPMAGSLGGQASEQGSDLYFIFNRGHNNVNDNDFKSIFEAALRNGNKPEGRTWEMRFDTIRVDSTGELSNYVQSLTQKGWTITGLEITNNDPFTVSLASGADYISLNDASFSDQLVITCPADKLWRIPWNQEYDFPTIDGGTIRKSIFDFIQGPGGQEGYGNQSIDMTQGNSPKDYNLDSFDIMFYVSGPSSAKPVRVVYNRLDSDVWVKFGDNQAMEFYYDNHSVLRFVDDNGNTLRVNDTNIQNYINDERLVVEGNVKYVFKEIRKSDFPGWKLVSMGADSTIDDENIYAQGSSISNTAFNKYVIRDIEYLDARYFKTMIGWDAVNYMNTVRTSSNLIRVSFSTDTALKSIPSLTTPNVEEFSFRIGRDIISIPAYDGHSIKKSLRIITGPSFGSKADSVNRVGGFDGIGANYDTQNTEYHRLEYNYIPNIEISDIITQFNMLATLKTGVTASIYLTTEQNAQISDEKKAIATNKGWTINVKNS